LPFHIVLVEPEIPANTGNIARTCAATGCSLHLVRPLGFSTNDKVLKRAGLDYWHSVDIHYHNSFWDLKDKFPDGRFFCVETNGSQYYTEFTYKQGDFFVFGKETKGLSKDILDAHAASLIRMPMKDTVRSLNLSNTAAIMVYEGLRQVGFPSMD
jgi:tRNA (cytidine/uridine-2'-O-)-methyltransferase